MPHIYIYILKSKLNQSYYIGSCNDVAVRLLQHNTSKVRSTKRYVPWEFIHREDYDSLSEARMREKQLKSWKNRRAIETLIDRGYVS